MLKSLGAGGRRELFILLSIILLVAITPLGREATSGIVLIAHRLLLITITLGSIAMLRNTEEPDVCPVFVMLCAVFLVLMGIAVWWNPGSAFDGAYRWYQHLFFGAAFLAMAMMHRERPIAWKTTIL